MAKDKGSKEAVTEQKPVEAESNGVDPDMQGLDEWPINEEGAKLLNFKRLWFKAKEAGEGAVLRGFPTGCIVVNTMHDGKMSAGEALEIATTRPCKLTNADGKTTVYPAGTPALIFCTEELMDLRPLAVAKDKVVEIAIRVGKRVTTGGGNTFQTMQFMLCGGRSYDRSEVGRLSVNPVFKQVAKLLDLKTEDSSPKVGGPPVLPQ